MSFLSVAVRILLAVVVGGLLGLERERRSSPAGFRTYMLVAIGSSMTIMLSQYIDLMLSTQWAAAAQSVGATHDVSRFGAQVINGVGFLGAGSIILTGRKRVKGLTTAAGSVLLDGKDLSTLREQGVTVFDIDLSKQPEDRRAQLGVHLSVYLPKGLNHTELLAQLAALGGTVSIEESQ